MSSAPAGLVGMRSSDMQCQSSFCLLWQHQHTLGVSRSKTVDETSVQDSCSELQADVEGTDQNEAHARYKSHLVRHEDKPHREAHYMLNM